MTYIEQGNYLEAGTFDTFALEQINIDPRNPFFHVSGNCLIETQTQTLVLGCHNSVIPDDGSVTVIGSWAFYNCVKLDSIVIPESVTDIGSYTFYECSSLKEITFGGTVAEWKELTAPRWEDDPDVSPDPSVQPITVTCSDGTVIMG